MIPENEKLIPEFPQRQDSTMDQLRDLAWVAYRLGMYDAGDHLRRHIEMLERPIDWGKTGKGMMSRVGGAPVNTIKGSVDASNSRKDTGMEDGR